MSACFYDNGGIMEGLDLHEYFTIGPLGVPVPVPNVVHIVGAPNLHPAATWGERTPTVTAESRKMIKRGFKIRLVPHLPVPAGPPHPVFEILQIAKVIALSSSEAFLGVASVTGEGGPLATCIYSCVGANGNCGPGVGAVLNPSSVVTSPSAADYASAVAAWVAGEALDAIWEKVDIPNPIIKWALKKYGVAPLVENIARAIAEAAL